MVPFLVFLVFSYAPIFLFYLPQRVFLLTLDDHHIMRLLLYYSFIHFHHEWDNRMGCVHESHKAFFGRFRCKSVYIYYVIMWRKTNFFAHPLWLNEIQLFGQKFRNWVVRKKKTMMDEKFFFPFCVSHGWCGIHYNKNADIQCKMQRYLLLVQKLWYWICRRCFALVEIVIICTFSAQIRHISSSTYCSTLY